MRDDLLDRVPCGILRLADDGTVLLTNSQLRDLLGYSSASVEGRHVDALLSPGARIFYQTHIFPLLRVEGRVDEVYLSLRSADGEDVPVLLNAIRREGDGGTGVSDWAVVVVRRRSRFEDELVQARKAAEEASRAKDRFLSMVSHDLRTPLSGIGMATHVLSAGAAGPVTERQLEALGRIESASRYLLRLVNDLLSFARLRQGPAAVEPGPIAVAEVLAQSASMVQHLAEEAGLTFAVEPAPPDVFVLADRDRLQQVVLNLLTNAVKFTGRGGQVSVAWERREGHVLLHVRDTGRGIPADQLNLVFDPFVQVGGAAAAPRGGGVGLGLAISRELVRAMGGEITVVSPEGVGSTFTVHLRAARPSAPDEGP